MVAVTRRLVASHLLDLGDMELLGSDHLEGRGSSGDTLFPSSSSSSR
jgi:hypothetical protein